LSWKAGMRKGTFRHTLAVLHIHSRQDSHPPFEPLHSHLKHRRTNEIVQSASHEAHLALFKSFQTTPVDTALKVPLLRHLSCLAAHRTPSSRCSWYIVPNNESKCLTRWQRLPAAAVRRHTTEVCVRTHWCARRNSDAGPGLEASCISTKFVSLLIKSVNTVRFKLTAFSLSLNAFHSCPINLLLSGNLMFLKSPLACLLTLNCTYEEAGRLTARSSWICCHFLEPLAFSPKPRRSFRLALLASWICSGVCDSTQCL
jgi:hypothetical protein